MTGSAALASAKSTGNVVVGGIKGGMVDVPLALAEGFRNAPRLWGDSVKEQEEIDGWKSGGVIAGKVCDCWVVLDGEGMMLNL